MNERKLTKLSKTWNASKVRSFYANTRVPKFKWKQKDFIWCKFLLLAGPLIIVTGTWGRLNFFASLGIPGVELGREAMRDDIEATENKQIIISRLGF